MLAIEVEYLTGRVYAADFRDDTQPEWPPHPARLFSALVAAHHDTSGSNAERAALQWLAGLNEAPHIVASDAGYPTPVAYFVPTNYPNKNGSTHPEQRSKQERSFPVHSPASPLVHFVWPTAEIPAAYAPALAGLVARVPALGRACSLVRLRVVGTAPPPNYVPDPTGTEVLRVFGEGRLEELEAWYRLNRRTQEAPQKRYRRLEPNTRPVSPTTCWGEMVVLQRKTGIALPIEAALTVTVAARKAFLSLAGDGKPLSDALSGHGEDTAHLGFAALPFVGHPHATGRLLGVALLLPRGLSPTDRRVALQTWARLDTLNLREELGHWEVEIVDFDVPTQTLQPETWAGPSTVWKTVTPILLDRFPKRQLSVETLLAQACQRVGLPSPVAIHYAPHAALPGVPAVREFRLRRTSDARPHYAVHATLRFAQPVTGPVLLGAGRYFGLGLLKPGEGSTW